MSQAVEIDVDLEEVVEYRGRQPDVIHRPDPAADEPRPACPEAEAHDGEYRRVSLVAIVSHRQLCQNPECFGGEQR